MIAHVKKPSVTCKNHAKLNNVASFCILQRNNCRDVHWYMLRALAWSMTCNQCSQFLESVPGVFDFCGMCSPLSRDQIKSKELSAKGILCPGKKHDSHSFHLYNHVIKGAETGHFVDSERQTCLGLKLPFSSLKRSKK